MSRAALSRYYRAGAAQPVYCCYLSAPAGNVCFIDAACCEFYLRRLLMRSRGFGIRLHAWCLIGGETYLLLTPHSELGLRNWIASVNRCFGEYFGQRYLRAIRIFPKLRALSRIQGDMALLNCQKFIEWEGARQSGFDHPGEYYWSSYSRHAFGSIRGSTGADYYSSHTPLPAMREQFAPGAAGRSEYREFVAQHFSEPCERFLRVSVTHGKPLGRASAVG